MLIDVGPVNPGTASAVLPVGEYNVAVVVVPPVEGYVVGAIKTAHVAGGIKFGSVATRSNWAIVEGDHSAASVVGKTDWATVEGGMEILR